MESKTKRKIAVLVNHSQSIGKYIAFLSQVFDVETVNANEWDSSKKIDLVLFTGGEDVDPTYYNENVGEYTHCNRKRDEYEMKLMFSRSTLRRIPKLGICRGAQFVTVMSGGKLVQDVNGHAISNLHKITYKNDYIPDMDITSTHHQMMNPYDMDEAAYEVIATSTNYLSDKYLNGLNKNISLPRGFKEAEIVYYPKTLSLAIQGHPEMDHCPNDTKQYCLHLIQEYLNLQ
jgi:gamma-glutamyl-gamma-aminobutyrate hydrolase PuuD